MTAATVLIPTHEHVEPLRHAVASAQDQSLQDFELFIVGDGVTDATRTLVAELSAADRRIRFFDYPKGPRKGEIHRHDALQHAQGRFVAYLGDDDCWMPNHLDVMGELLSDADFGHTLQICVDETGDLVVLPGDLENAAFRDRMLHTMYNCFDFTFAGHTLQAYRKLPHGWRTTPKDFPWTDLYMWRQFLSEPWCRARSAMVPTGINTSTHRRPNLNDFERAQHLGHWREQVGRPEFRETLWREVARQLSGQAVRLDLERIHHATENHELTEQNHGLADAHRALAEMRASTSWQVTRPLRALAQITRKFGAR